MQKFSKRADEFKFLEDLDVEFNLKFHKAYNAANLAKELYYLGFKTPESMKKEFEIRNYEVDKEVNDIIKEVIETCDKSYK
jgi:Leu/Phe-tRNA-protein transferase